MAKITITIEIETGPFDQMSINQFNSRGDDAGDGDDQTSTKKKRPDDDNDAGDGDDATKGKKKRPGEDLASDTEPYERKKR